MPENIDERLFQLLNEFKSNLPGKVYDHIHNLIQHREWGLALEALCDQLFEDSIFIAPPLLETIKNLAQEMDLPAKSWQMLTSNPAGER
jgi:hypothetical protein